MIPSRAVTIALAGLLVLGSRRAFGLEIDAALAFASPVGSLQRGSNLGDTTSGAVPLDIAGTWFFTPRVGVRVSGSCALTIPKLCASAGDCEASLGRDVAIEVGVRLALPKVGRIEPLLDAGVGYEWYAATLADSGVTSTRSYAGPILLDVDVVAPVRVSRAFAIGPAVGARVGGFASAALSTPTSTVALAGGGAVHGWLRLGLDARFLF